MLFHLFVYVLVRTTYCILTFQVSLPQLTTSPSCPSFAVAAAAIPRSVLSQGGLNHWNRRACVDYTYPCAGNPFGKSSSCHREGSSVHVFL